MGEIPTIDTTIRFKTQAALRDATAIACVHAVGKGLRRTIRSTVNDVQLIEGYIHMCNVTQYLNNIPYFHIQPPYLHLETKWARQ
jgi:hypothetical protein